MAVTLLDLPSHVVMEVLHQLNDVLDLCACARTCRTLYHLCCSPELWPHYRPAGPLVRTVQQLLSYALGRLPPPIFSVQLEPARSRKFPICVPLHNLRGVLGVVDATALAERASSTLQDLLAGLKHHQQALHAGHNSLPPRIAACQFCRADFGAVRFGLNAAIAVPLQLLYINQLPRPPCAHRCTAVSDSAHQQECCPRAVEVHDWAELQQHAAQELWRRVDHAAMSLAPKFQRQQQHAVLAIEAMLVSSGPWSQFRSQLDEELFKQLAAQHATGGSLIPSTLLDGMRDAVMHLTGLCEDMHARGVQKGDVESGTMPSRMRQCTRVVVTIASLLALQDSVLQALELEQPAAAHNTAQPLQQQEPGAEEITSLPGGIAHPQSSIAARLPHHALAAVSAAAHEECAIDCLVQLDSFVAELLAVKWHRTARPRQPPDVLASRRPDFNPTRLTLNQLIFRSTVHSMPDAAMPQHKLDLGISTPHTASAVPIDQPAHVARAGKRAALQLMDLLENLMDTILKYLRRCRVSQSSMLGYASHGTTSAPGHAMLLECLIKVQQFIRTGQQPADSPVQQSAVLNWCMVQACLDCAHWYMYILGLDQHLLVHRL